MNFDRLSDNRYLALEETRKILGFKKQEWRSLLAALSKTDNGWFDFLQGNLRISLEKFADLDELHMEIRLKTDKIVKTVEYTYDLNEFTKHKVGSLPVDCNEE